MAVIARRHSGYAARIGHPTDVPARLGRPRAAAGAARAVDGATIAVAALCAALSATLLVLSVRLPPHEDEALALLAGRGSLGGLVRTVLEERGGAPLHFVVAWAIVHAGGGLELLRLVSAACVVASVPALYALAREVADSKTALVATALQSACWMALYHGVFGRMYGVFLLASTLSYLALVHALSSDRRGDWALWALSGVAAAAVHPYGALVLAAGAATALVARATSRRALAAIALAGAACLPFWLADLVLAGRFGVGIGGGGSQLASPGSLASYLVHVAGDFSAGWRPAAALFVALAALGLASIARERTPAAVLCVAVLAAPAIALAIARIGDAASPRSRHLIFALPVFATLAARGLVVVTRRGGTIALAAALAAAVCAELAWAWHKTPVLFRGDPPARVAARQAAAAWVAASAQPGDVLFGYEPVYLVAWQRSRRLPGAIAPRADPVLLLRALGRAPEPLGRGTFVLDAGDVSSMRPAATIPLRLPVPRAAFAAVRFGPYLVVRTKRSTVTPARFLAAAASVERLGVALGVGDAAPNLAAVEGAKVQVRGGAPPSTTRSRSTSSR